MELPLVILILVKKDGKEFCHLFIYDSGYIMGRIIGKMVCNLEIELRNKKNYEDY